MNLLELYYRYKKIIFIILFLIIIGIVGYFLWILFFQPAGILKPPISITETTTPGGLPISGEGGPLATTTTGPGVIPGSPDITRPGAQPTTITQPVSPTAQGGITKVTNLYDKTTIAPTLSKTGKDVQFYNKEDGKFYRINANGDMIPMSDRVFHDVEKVAWAPNTTKAVLEYPDGSNIVYDFNTNKQVTLPKHWEDFNFSTDSNQLVMKSIGLDPDNRWLIVSNSDGSKARALEAIGENADKIIPSWSPNNQSVAMYTDGVDLDRQELFFIGLNGENFKSTIVEGRSIQSKWSEKGDKLLYSAYNTKNDVKPVLWVVNAQGENIGTNRQSLDLNTWAEKCTFVNNKEVYCAVPDDLPRGAGMLPDLAKRTQDSLYKIDIETGVKKLIAIPDGKYNISQLVVSEDQSKLFFTDQINNRLYKIDLK